MDGQRQGTREGVHGTDVGLRGAGAEGTPMPERARSVLVSGMIFPALISSSICAGAAKQIGRLTAIDSPHDPNGHIRGDTEA